MITYRILDEARFNQREILELVGGIRTMPLFCVELVNRVL